MRGIDTGILFMPLVTRFRKLNIRYKNLFIQVARHLCLGRVWMKENEMSLRRFFREYRFSLNVLAETMKVCKLIVQAIYMFHLGGGSSEAALEKSRGHRRAASADADIGTWKITVSDDVQQSSSSNGSSGPTPMHKVASLSGFFGSMETISKFKWPKNGYRKLKAVNPCEEEDKALLPPAGLNGGIEAYYERSKSSLGNCNECYDKQLHGWYGALHRQLQRSQYQMQYNRPVQIAVWAVILLCFIVLIAFCTM
uniref:Uncharacterized protein n=1 Tax=Glycine max TaxID=3847 RepID=C6TE49_SOYBN|nr:unknown [Glycine max]